VSTKTSSSKSSTHRSSAPVQPREEDFADGDDFVDALSKYQDAMERYRNRCYRARLERANNNSSSNAPARGSSAAVSSQN
jgi:6-phosphogluconolactonase (cycloisomerase 2 family)